MKKKNRKITILLFLIIIIFNNILYSQSLNFFREKIEVELKGDYCIIKGLYYLKNSSFIDVNRLLYYPFVINDDLPFPYKIQITNLKKSKEISYKANENGVYFSVKVMKDSISIYKVIYYQKTKANRMEYILETTQEWGRPFEFAEYIYKMPTNYKMIYSSIIPDEKNIKENKTIYKCSKINFMPTKNLIIKWEKIK